MTTALCPGSFDPPTNGHIDVIERGRLHFDRLIVAVVDNPKKQSLFDVEERVAMLREVLGEGIEVMSFRGLLVDFAQRVGADVVLKGLRDIGDFEYEVEMAQMNRTVGGTETVFMVTRPEWSFVSSSLVKEVASLGGSVSGLVPEAVAKALQERLG